MTILRNTVVSLLIVYLGIVCIELSLPLALLVIALSAIFTVIMQRRRGEPRLTAAAG